MSDLTPAQLEAIYGGNSLQELDFFAPRSKTERAQDFLGSFVEGAAAMPADAADAFLLLTDKIVGGHEGDEAESASIVGNAIRDFAEFVSPESNTAEGEAGMGFEQTFGRALGSSVGIASMGVLGGASRLLGASSKVAQMAATSAALGTGMGANAASLYYEAKAHEASDEDAWAAYMSGLAIGATEVLPLANMFARINKSTGGSLQRQLLPMGLKGAAEEGAQEVLQAGLENTVAAELFDEERELIEGMVESGGAGALTGFLMTVLGAAGRRAVQGPGVQEGPTGPTGTTDRPQDLLDARGLPPAGQENSGETVVEESDTVSEAREPLQEAPPEDLAPALEAFAQGNQVDPATVQPVEPTEQDKELAGKFLGESGAKLVVVDAGRPLARPAAVSQDRKYVIIDARQPEEAKRARVLHEAVHLIGAESTLELLVDSNPEAFQQPLQALGGRTFAEEYARRFGEPLTPERELEESVAFAAENIPAVLEDLFQREGALEDAIRANLGFGERLLEALSQVLQRIGINSRSPVVQALDAWKAQLGELTAAEQELSPRTLVGLGETLRGAIRAAGVQEITAPAADAPLEAPGRATEAPPSESARAATTAAQGIEGTQSPRVTPKKSRKSPQKPVSPRQRAKAGESGLTKFLQATGGLAHSTDAAELAEQLGIKPRGLGQLVHKPGTRRGASIDEAIEAAIDAGFFPGKTLGDVAPQDLFDAIEADDGGTTATTREKTERAAADTQQRAQAEAHVEQMSGREVREAAQDLELGRGKSISAKRALLVEHFATAPAADPEVQQDIPFAAAEPEGGIPAKPPADAAVIVPTKPGTIKAWVGTNVRSRGDLPPEVFAAKIRRDAWLRKHQLRTKFYLADYRRALKAAYKVKRVKDLTDQQRALVDHAMRNEDVRKSLPTKELRDATRAMRNHLDLLSHRYLDDGIVEGKLAAHVAENMGIYLRRSYQAFTDPKWTKKVDQDVKNKAVALVRTERGLSQEDAEGVIDKILVGAEESQSPMAALKAGTLGSKDLSTLKRRKELAPEIKALLGEFKDPMFNYANSVQSMAGLIANHQFLEEIATAGDGVFFHDASTVKDGVSYSAEIASEQTQVLSPLNGLHTTKEIKQAMEEATSPEIVGTFLKWWMRANSVSKVNKTVFSWQTQMRNLLGNPMFGVASGNWGFLGFTDAAKATWADIANKEGTELRAYNEHLAELGVTGGSTSAGEVQDTLRDASVRDNDWAAHIGEGPVLTTIRKAQELYAAGDDVWKVYAFESEKAKYTKAMPEASVEEVEQLAAERVRELWPDYSQINRSIKKLRRFPLVGSFVSFSAEVYRVSKNLIRVAHEEINSDNPAIRKIGWQRAAGTLVAATAGTGAAMGLRHLLGITDDEDEASRIFLPPWSENSELLWLNNADGERRYLDISHLDPFSVIKQPLMALFRGEDPADAAEAMFGEMLEPFLSEEIFTSAVLDVKRNTKGSTGQPVYDEHAGAWPFVRDVTAHLWKSVEPGTITSLRRIDRAARGEVSMRGKTNPLWVESLAGVTGMRVATMDVEQALFFRGAEHQRKLNAATRSLTAVARRRGTVTDEELSEAYESMESRRRATWEEAYEATQGAQLLGLTEEKVRSALEGSVSKRGTQDLLRAVYRPYRPSSTFLSSASQAADAEHKAELRRRIAFIRDLTRKAKEQ